MVLCYYAFGLVPYGVNTVGYLTSIMMIKLIILVEIPFQEILYSGMKLKNGTCTNQFQEQ